jgi:hypothetical protein
MSVLPVSEGKVVMSIETWRSPADRSRSDLWEYRSAFAVTFAVMLVPTILSRLGRAHRAGDMRRRSIFGEAGARTDRVLPFMFMS